MNEVANTKKKLEPLFVNLKDLLSLEKRYFIPSYQRPYDWEEQNILKLIESLNMLNDEKDFIFLGNMEFREEGTIHQIIDGQQRITTLLILLNYLNPTKYSNNVIKNMLKIKIQSNDTNEKTKDEQYKFINFLNNKDYTEEELKELNGHSNASLKRKKISNFRNNNVYKLNYYYMKDALNKANIISEKSKQEFAENILNNVYIVAIYINNEIKESEAISIFDTINTTGKPLETRDIFKIKMYEYSKSKNEANQDEIIKKINMLYNNIQSQNEKIIEAEKNIKENEINGKSEFSEINIISETFSFEDILKIYKFILIARVVNKKDNAEIANYKSELFSMSIDNFYDKLFLRILNNSAKKQFEGFENEKINVQDLYDIYEAYVNLSNIILNAKYINSETYFAYKMLKQYTRYSWTYNFLPILFLWRFKRIDSEFSNFVINISKLLEYFSITQEKVINEAKTFINNIIIKIVNMSSSAKEINQEIEERLKKCSKEKLIEKLEGEIAKIWINKEISCLIIAKDAESKKSKNEDMSEDELLQRYQTLFTRKFDIEHICAIDNDDKRFKDNKDYLGNLMLLEYSINRNIKNNNIEKKLEKYKNSKFKVVKNEVNCIQKNGVDQYYNSFKKRQNEKVNIVKNYILKI